MKSGNTALYTRWLLNKWYIDELYDALFVNRAKDAGKTCGSLTQRSSTAL